MKKIQHNSTLSFKATQSNQSESTEASAHIARVLVKSIANNSNKALNALRVDDKTLLTLLNRLETVNVSSQFESEFLKCAQNKNEFHSLMSSVFGDSYNKNKAEEFRQKALKNDFSWLPKVEFVDDKTLNQANGAYSAQENTIFLNASKAKNKNLMMETFVEEAGHHLDSQLNIQDSRGDEGELFRLQLSGQKLSTSQVQNILNENDHGVLNVNGKKVEVEFMFGFIKKAASGLGKVVKRGLRNVTHVAKKAVCVVRNTVTWPYRKIKKGLHNLKEKCLKTGDTLVWIFTKRSIKHQLRHSLPKMSFSERNELTCLIEKSVKNELKKTKKHIVTMSKAEITALVTKHADPLLNKYVAKQMRTKISEGLPKQLSKSEKNIMSSQIESTVMEKVKQQNTTLLDLAKSNQLEALVTKTAYEVLEPKIEDMTRQSVENSLTQSVPSYFVSAYTNEIMNRVLDASNNNLASMTESQITTLVQNITQEVLRSWNPQTRS